MMSGKHNPAHPARCGLLLATILSIGASSPAAQTDSLSTVAVWITHSAGVQGVGALPEYLLDRLGSNGVYPVSDPERMRAAGSFVGLDRTANFDKQRLAALGRSLSARWVIWVKVADRAVEYKKGLSIPHLFIRRKAVSHMLVDARVVDVYTGELVASNRWRLDKSGAGSYQVAEDTPQDPVYNNSADQFYHHEQELEREAARSVSMWFKSLIPRTAKTPERTETHQPGLPPGPFGVKDAPPQK